MNPRSIRIGVRSDSNQDPMSLDWCGLIWTQWFLFNDLKPGILPKSPGLYRVRPSGKQFIMYVGQTSDNLDSRVRRQLVGSYFKSDNQMPFNDPHTASQSLWAWNDSEGWDYECSVAPVEPFSNDPRRELEGWEAYILWKYRCSSGESTICNHGRFHPDYVRSRNRKTGVRGGKRTGSPNLQSLISHSPLKMTGSSGNEDWMGLQWSDRYHLSKDCILSVPQNEGLYCIMDTDEVVYIGESLNIKNRMKNHLKNNECNLDFRFTITSGLPKNQLLELENDLIGAFIEQNRKIPKFQFTNSI